jgi:hypothetical protein
MHVKLPHLVMALLAVSVTPRIAFALDRGECGTPQEITTKLKAEDQHSFASAEHVTKDQGVDALLAVIFTVSGNRSVGYILKSDRPSDVRATRFCVHERLADLRIYDARKPGVPAAALIKASETEGRRKCSELIKAGTIRPDTCGTLNKSLEAGEPHGERVMFQGFNVSKKADGSYVKDGTLTSVTVTLPGGLTEDIKPPTKPLYGGILFTSLPDGATTLNVMLASGNYTPYGLALLE